MFPLLRHPTPDSGQPDAEPRAAVLHRLAATGQQQRGAGAGAAGRPVHGFFVDSTLPVPSQ
eukprot:2488243-Alexandrium_andersonii.AAC.1